MGLHTSDSRFVGHVELIEQELVGVDNVNVVRGQRIRREITQVGCHDECSVTTNRRSSKSAN